MHYYHYYYSSKGRYKHSHELRSSIVFDFPPFRILELTSEKRAVEILEQQEKLHQRNKQNKSYNNNSILRQNSPKYNKSNNNKLVKKDGQRSWTSHSWQPNYDIKHQYDLSFDMDPVEVIATTANVIKTTKRLSSTTPSSNISSTNLVNENKKNVQTMNKVKKIIAT